MSLTDRKTKALVFCTMLIFIVIVLAGCQWDPPAGMTWQWQIDGAPVDTSVDAQVYDIDGFTTTAEEVTELHNLNRKVICYFSSAYEDWRPDAGMFPPEIIGTEIGGFPGDHWVDIRAWSDLEPIYQGRLDIAVAKGCDGIEWDIMETAFEEVDTGFDGLTPQDQLTFNQNLSTITHARELAVGLKNDAAQVDELVTYFDFAVVEECVQFSECDAYLPFINADKPVFHAEYQGTMTYICANRPASFSTIKKNYDLNAYPYQRCP